MIPSFSNSFSRLIEASFAVITHFTNVICRGCIGLSPKKSTICKQNHSKYIWEDDPFIGINIFFKKIFCCFFWINCSKEEEVTYYHKTLNVMSIANISSLLNNISYTIHPCFTIMKHVRYWLLMIKEVKIPVFWHL